MTIAKSRRQSRGGSSAGANPEPRELLASTGYLLARLGMESRRRFSRMMAQHGLTPHHFNLLMALNDHNTLPQLLLGKVMGVDPRNTVAIVAQLERLELIERRRDSTDRRRYAIALTATGRAKMRSVRAAGARIEHEMLGGLGLDEQRTLRRLLRKLLETTTAAGTLSSGDR